MKRITAIIIMIAALLVTGCAGNEKESTEKNSDKPEAGPAQQDAQSLTIGLSQIGSESDWRIASTDSVRNAFSVENGYNLIFDDAQQKQENQLKAIREFIDQGVDYIILDPVVETGWDSVLTEAKEAGIPVIVYDRQVKVSDTSLYTCWIGSDFRLEGDRACAWLSEYLASKGISREINIVNIQGTPDASAQIGRSSALDEAVRSNRNWKLLARDTGDFTTAKGKEVMNSLLKQYGHDIDVVYAENDNMAYGAIEIMEQRGFRPGLDIDNGEILIISFDATKSGLELTLDGKIALNAECNPLYGTRLVEIVEELEAGREVEKETYIDEEQFSGIGYIGTIQVEDEAYTVTQLTQQLIDERQY